MPETSRLAAPAPGEAPLTPAEVVEMKEHLAFLRRYKEVLRLKLNAVEDLLVNQQREPADRGVCRHLLGKVDRAVVEHAIERDPLRGDAAARARMLAGAVRLTADVGVLLAYLEALAHVRSHAEAAQAFAEVVRRIDFESVSATRLARLLQVLIDTFVDHERVQVLFSLLAGPAFRRAFDAALPTFPPAVAEVCAPLRAVHRRLLEDGGGPEAPELLAKGMEQVLSAPDPVLRSYAEPLRAGMLELALGGDVPAEVADRAVGVLLPSLARDGRTYARFAIRRAGQLLARHVDDRARAVLEELRRAQPGTRTAERWLAALDARRFGRIALAGEPPARGRLIAAFWLDGQRPVWLRTASAGAGERLAAEARVQAELALPGVATLVEHGVALGLPYVAVLGPGRPLAREEPLDPSTALGIVAAAARVLRAVALAGIALPDAEAERFLHTPPPGPAVTLADLDGARRAEPPVAAAEHVALATGLARQIVPVGPGNRQMRELGEQMARASDLPALIALVERAALHAARD
ncbi:MAG: hypothetical protein E6J55_22300 [Deltaproteobacteria bacterium]|nr:MAG: hypothetical protein E6J55_22300 [Deltaproteobacteria bacterium]